MKAATKETLIEVLAGILGSGLIFVVMFYVILVPLVAYVYSTNAPLLWDAVMYVPYLVLGSVSFPKNFKALGVTLLVAGLVAAVFFYGAVNSYGVY